MRRLFAFLAARDTSLNSELIERVVIPNATIPKFALPKGTAAARAARILATSSRKRGARRASKRLATALCKTAKALSKRPAARVRPRAKTALPAAIGPVWQSIGPTSIPDGQTYGSNRIDVAGRLAAIAVDPGDPKHILVGAACGGVWESFDDGVNWAPRTDQMPTLAIGALAFDVSNHKRVYAGSGEGNAFSALGAGVFISTDGGTNWTVLASEKFVGVGFYDLVVDPVAPSILYAATTHGFFKSTNKGSSWSPKRAGQCWKISIHPKGGKTEILAAFADGLFASTNAGDTFSAVALPDSPGTAWTRLAVDRVAAAPDVAYVFGAIDKRAHLWRRSGTVWAKMTGLPAIEVEQAWYDWYVAASPDKGGQVYLGAIDAWRGDAKDKTWTWRNITTQGANSIHPDQHCLVFSPGNPKTIYAGNDGGIYRSANSGNSWKALNKGLGITEIEYMASDPGTWKWLIAGTQDNGTIRFTGSNIWDHVADGDGGDCGVNQLDPNIIYHSYYNVTLERSNNKGASWTDLDPPNPYSLFYPPVEIVGQTVAIGANSLVVSRDSGKTWKTISLGLPGDEAPSAMRAVDANTLLIGTDHGRILKVFWTGSAWKKQRLASPMPKYISCITVDPSNPQRVWATSSLLTNGTGNVYRSDDGGTKWKNCSSGLPRIPVNAVVVDPANYKRVWIAADVGVHQTLDSGVTWTAFSIGLPNALAADLLFHKQDRYLICGTRNRGAWAVHVP